MVELICTALSATLFYFSQGLSDAWLLTWFAPVPLLWLAFGNTQAWRLAAVSFVAFLVGQIYILQCYGDAPPWAILLLFGLRPLLFPLAVIFARVIQRRCGAALALLAFPLCWTAMEYIASLLSTHGTLGAIAYSQVSAPIVLQSASLLGMYSVTFVLSLFASALALVARVGRPAFVAAGGGLVLCALDLAFGAVRLLAPQLPVVRVAAVADMSLLTSEYRADDLNANLKGASVFASAARDLASRGATLIVTPEESLVTRRAWHAEVFAPLQAASRETGAQIVAGFLEVAPPGDIAVAFAKDTPWQIYAKRHLLLPIEARYTPGTEPEILGGGTAMAICKDMDFPNTIRKDARHGITMMAVPAWDFGVDGWLHGRMAIMRGVENGFAIVRAASNGLLTASDAQGRLVAKKVVSPDHRDWILADVSPGPGPTFYTAVGDVLPQGSLVLTLVLGGFSVRRRYRNKPDGK